MPSPEDLAAQAFGRDIIAARDFERLSEVFSDDLVDHDPAAGQSGLDGVKKYWRDLAVAFPDFDIHPDVAVASEDYVVIGYLLSGTHTGEYMGHAPTGKRFTVRVLQIGRFRDGKVVERWGSTDSIGILRQLGLGEGAGMSDTA